MPRGNCNENGLGEIKGTQLIFILNVFEAASSLILSYKGGHNFAPSCNSLSRDKRIPNNLLSARINKATIDLDMSA